MEKPAPPRAGPPRSLPTLQSARPAKPPAATPGPLDKAVPDIPCRTVLATHATEIWPEPHGGLQSLCLPIRQARRVTQRPKPVQRRAVYAFDLLEQARTAQAAETRMAD